MAETLFQELKRYVLWDPADEAALRKFHPLAQPEFERIADVFYRRIQDHADARKALEAGESTVGQLKVSLRAWMDVLLAGPWDEEYYELRARIGRVHVRVALPQHYMFGAMDVLRQELLEVIERSFAGRPEEERAIRAALGKILDLELAIMLHTYREDLLAQQTKVERLATFGQLVASIGHELRNPLGVIESSVYILGGRLGADDDRARKHVDRIGEQVAVANQIISDLLDMIRERPLALERVRLAGLVAAAVEVIPRSPEVRIVLDGLDALPEVAADASKLRQVFVNLLDNAVHAVGAGGEIRVRGQALDDQILITVEDTGPGIDPTVRGRLFEPLITTKVRGIGLGLALVRRIVEHHGGTVAHEAPPGGGARFVVRLPLEGPRA